MAKTVLTGGGVVVEGSEGPGHDVVKLEGLTVQHEEGPGLYVCGGASGVVAKRCAFERCGTIGVFVSGVGSSCELIDCAARDNGECGVFAYQGGRALLRGFETEAKGNAGWGVAAHGSGSEVHVLLPQDRILHSVVSLNLQGNGEAEQDTADGGKVVVRRETKNRS